MNTITSIRIDSELMDTIKIYSEIENVSQTDFINELISDGLENYFLQRSGGAVFTLPNPCNFVIEEDSAKEALTILCDAANEIHDLRSNLPVPLFAMFAFFEQRLFYELPEDREMFKRNLILDSTRSDKTAENK